MSSSLQFDCVRKTKDYSTYILNTKNYDPQKIYLFFFPGMESIHKIIDLLRQITFVEHPNECTLERTIFRGHRLQMFSLDKKHIDTCQRAAALCNNRLVTGSSAEIRRKTTIIRIPPGAQILMAENFNYQPWTPTECELIRQISENTSSAGLD